MSKLPKVKQLIKNRARIAAEKASKAGETSAQKQLRYAKELTKEINKQLKWGKFHSKNGEDQESIKLRKEQLQKLAKERYLARKGKLKIFDTPQSPQSPSRILTCFLTSFNSLLFLKCLTSVLSTVLTLIIVLPLIVIIYNPPYQQ